MSSNHVINVEHRVAWVWYAGDKRWVVCLKPGKSIRRLDVLWSEETGIVCVLSVLFRNDGWACLSCSEV